MMIYHRIIGWLRHSEPSRSRVCGARLSTTFIAGIAPVCALPKGHHRSKRADHDPSTGTTWWESRPGYIDWLTQDEVWRMVGRVQTKVLPGDVLVAAVAAVQSATGRWAHLEDLEAAFPGLPVKVVLAKARKLVRSGAITLCACGCRGEFEVPGLPLASWQQRLDALNAQPVILYEPADDEAAYGYGLEEPSRDGGEPMVIRARENRLTATQTAGAMLLIGLLSDADDGDQMALAEDVGASRPCTSTTGARRPRASSRRCAPPVEAASCAPARVRRARAVRSGTRRCGGSGRRMSA